MSKTDLYFMQEALKEAKKAFLKNEVPIGCVLVREGKILARGHNLVEKKMNACQHAEIVCINKATKKIQNFRLNECILYTTLEPCLMCSGAILLSRVKKIIYAAKDLRHGALVSVYQVFSSPHPIHTPLFEQGPLEKESSDLLKSFFKKRRAENG
jgi:tRNA(adenine34) deaminase